MTSNNFHSKYDYNQNISYNTTYRDQIQPNYQSQNEIHPQSQFHQFYNSTSPSSSQLNTQYRMDNNSHYTKRSEDINPSTIDLLRHAFFDKFKTFQNEQNILQNELDHYKLLYSKQKMFTDTLISHQIPQKYSYSTITQQLFDFEQSPNLSLSSSPINNFPNTPLYQLHYYLQQLLSQIQNITNNYLHQQSQLTSLCIIFSYFSTNSSSQPFSNNTKSKSTSELLYHPHLHLYPLLFKHHKPSLTQQINASAQDLRLISSSSLNLTKRSTFDQKCARKRPRNAQYDEQDDFLPNQTLKTSTLPIKNHPDIFLFQQSPVSSKKSQTNASSSTIPTTTFHTLPTLIPLLQSTFSQSFLFSMFNSTTTNYSDQIMDYHGSINPSSTSASTSLSLSLSLIHSIAYQILLHFVSTTHNSSTPNFASHPNPLHFNTGANRNNLSTNSSHNNQSSTSFSHYFVPFLQEFTAFHNFFETTNQSLFTLLQLLSSTSPIICSLIFSTLLEICADKLDINSQVCSIESKKKDFLPTQSNDSPLLTSLPDFSLTTNTTSNSQANIPKIAATSSSDVSYDHVDLFYSSFDMNQNPCPKKGFENQQSQSQPLSQPLSQSQPSPKSQSQPQPQPQSQFQSQPQSQSQPQASQSFSQQSPIIPTSISPQSMNTTKSLTSEINCIDGLVGVEFDFFCDIDEFSINNMVTMENIEHPIQNPQYFLELLQKPFPTTVNDDAHNTDNTNEAYIMSHNLHSQHQAQIYEIENPLFGCTNVHSQEYDIFGQVTPSYPRKESRCFQKDYNEINLTLDDLNNTLHDDNSKNQLQFYTNNGENTYFKHNTCDTSNDDAIDLDFEIQSIFSSPYSQQLQSIEPQLNHEQIQLPHQQNIPQIAKNHILTSPTALAYFDTNDIFIFDHINDDYKNESVDIYSESTTSPLNHLTNSIQSHGIPFSKIIQHNSMKSFFSNNNQLDNNINLHNVDQNQVMKTNFSDSLRLSPQSVSATTHSLLPWFSMIIQHIFNMFAILLQTESHLDLIFSLPLIVIPFQTTSLPSHLQPIDPTLQSYLRFNTDGLDLSTPAFFQSRPSLTHSHLPQPNKILKNQNQWFSPETLTSFFNSNTFISTQSNSAMGTSASMDSCLEHSSSQVNQQQSQHFSSSLLSPFSPFSATSTNHSSHIIQHETKTTNSENHKDVVERGFVMGSLFPQSLLNLSNDVHHRLSSYYHSIQHIHFLEINRPPHTQTRSKTNFQSKNKQTTIQPTLNETLSSTISSSILHPLRQPPSINSLRTPFSTIHHPFLPQVPPTLQSPLQQSCYSSPIFDPHNSVSDNYITTQLLSLLSTTITTLSKRYQQSQNKLCLQYHSHLALFDNTNDHHIYSQDNPSSSRSLDHIDNFNLNPPQFPCDQLFFQANSFRHISPTPSLPSSSFLPSNSTGISALQSMYNSHFGPAPPTQQQQQHNNNHVGINGFLYHQAKIQFNSSNF